METREAKLKVRNTSWFTYLVAPTLLALAPPHKNEGVNPKIQTPFAVPPPSEPYPILLETRRTFVEEVLDVREVQTSTEEETTKGHHLQFKCQIRGWQQEARARLRAHILGLTDVGLRQYLVHSKGRVLFHFASTMWPTISPRYGEDGWWYAAREEVTYLECGVCEKRILKGQFEQKACNDIGHQTCQACVARRTRDAKRQARASQKAAAPAGRADGRPVRNSKRHISYVEVGSSDEELLFSIQEDTYL